MLKINRDHRARLVSSNWESFAYTNSKTILLLYAGDIRVPPRVPASGPEPCGGNYSCRNNVNPEYFLQKPEVKAEVELKTKFEIKKLTNKSIYFLLS